MILTTSYPSYWGFPGVSDCKESAFNSENLGLILGSGRLSLGRAEEPGMATVHGGLKELDTTEWLKHIHPTGYFSSFSFIQQTFIEPFYVTDPGLNLRNSGR